VAFSCGSAAVRVNGDFQKIGGSTTTVVTDRFAISAALTEVRNELAITGVCTSRTRSCCRQPSSCWSNAPESHYIESEEWQLGEFHPGISELDGGNSVSHEKVAKWLGSWRKRGETKAPR
jgi:predicted transcriptional regulator